MPLKFREIEVFWAVCKTGAVKSAAELLNVSQPAVSMMLRSAEERFGVRLFVRSGGGVRPTPEARALFAPANNLLMELQELERQVERVSSGVVGDVRIAATPTMTAAFVHRPVLRFRELYPDVNVTVRTIPTEQTAQMVAERRVDFGVAYGPVDHPETQSEDLGSTEVACVFPLGHRLEELERVTPSALAGETVMSYRTDTPLGRELERSLRAGSGELDIPVRVTALTAAHFAERGLGIALIDPFILNSELFANLTLRPFAPTTRARVQILTPRGEPLSITARDFQNEIRAAVPRRFSSNIPIAPPAELR